MSKSIPAILGLGAAACVILSLLMKNLTEQQVKQKRSPFAAVVENRLGAKLVGPVRIDEEFDGVWLRLVVRARVMAGLNMRRLANTIGLEVWLGARRAGQRPDEVLVVVRDDDGGEPIEVRVAPPAGGR